jgi:syntaxin 1B/2/3
LETIQRYQTVEQESRKKQRQKMERQFKIVKPEATQDEVNAALDSSGQSNRIFEQAVRAFR